MGVWMPHYTGEQKKIALEMLGECESVAEAARRFGYPSRDVFYHRAKNDDAAGKRVEGKISSHHPAGIREEAIPVFAQALSSGGGDFLSDSVTKILRLRAWTRRPPYCPDLPSMSEFSRWGPSSVTTR